MCFPNSIDFLNKFRNSKKSFVVWKAAWVDSKTGLATSSYSGDRDLVVWSKKTIVVPSKIRRPLRDKQSCSSGLYFYTSKKSLLIRSFGRMQKVAIKARVKPEDIIAVDYNGSTICCVAAFVLDAPNPDQAKMRIKYLNECIKDAKHVFKRRRDQAKEWEAERPEKEEALQQMLDEVKELGN